MILHVFPCHYETNLESVETDPALAAAAWWVSAVVCAWDNLFFAMFETGPAPKMSLELWRMSCEDS